MNGSSLSPFLFSHSQVHQKNKDMIWNYLCSSLFNSNRNEQYKLFLQIIPCPSLMFNVFILMQIYIMYTYMYKLIVS